MESRQPCLACSAMGPAVQTHLALWLDYAQQGFQIHQQVSRHAMQVVHLIESVPHLHL